MAGVKGLGAAKTYDGAPLRIGIVHARWNTRIIDALLSGTVSALRASGVKEENLVIQSVPGSYELPYAVHRMYVASQTQAAASSVGGVGGALLGSATDLLGGSATDLTKLPTGKKEGSAATASAGKGESEVGKEGAKQPFDAIIAIGALIKGSTMHFEYISDAVSHGLMRVQLELGVPVIFGLLTLLTEEQGLERAAIAGEAGNEGHNHGDDWGRAAVELGMKRRGWGEGRFVE